MHAIAMCEARMRTFYCSATGAQSELLVQHRPKAALFDRHACCLIEFEGSSACSPVATWPRWTAEE